MQIWVLAQTHPVCRLNGGSQRLLGNSKALGMFPFDLAYGRIVPNLCSFHGNHNSNEHN